MPKEDAELFLRLSTPFTMALTGESGCPWWEEFVTDRGIHRGGLAALVEGGQMTLEQAMANVIAFDALWQRDYAPKSEAGQAGTSRSSDPEVDKARTGRARSKPMRDLA